MKNIHVICGLDSQIECVKECLKSCLKIFKNENIAIASFNFENDEQIKLKNLANENKILFHEIKIKENNHIDINQLKKLRELYGSIKISDYFHSLGYENVYLLHNDLIVERDYTEKFEKYQNEKWSIICPFISHIKQLNNFAENWEIAKTIPSKQIENTEYRLSNCIVIYNKEFIKEIKKHSSIEHFFNNFKDPSIYCDCSCFDLNYYNFTVSPILEKISEEARRIENQNWKEFIAKNNKIYYLHFGANHKHLMKNEK